MKFLTVSFIDLIYKIVIVFAFIWLGLHISNLVVTNRELIKSHKELSKENNLLNQKQIQLLDENKQMLDALIKIRK